LYHLKKYVANWLRKELRLMNSLTMAGADQVLSRSNWTTVMQIVDNRDRK
jgi:hypothetical protein